MSILKLLIVEGNTKEENSNFNKAGCVSQSENFKQHIKIFEPDCEVDIAEPGDDNSIAKIVLSLKKYNGVVLTGSTLRINDNSNEVRKNIEFAKKNLILKVLIGLFYLAWEHLAILWKS